MKKKIHYCFIASSFDRTDPLIIYRQGKYLASSGFRVTYIVSDNYAEEYKFGIDIIPSGYTPNSRIKRIFFTKKYLFKKAMYVSADIYQISEPAQISLGLKLKMKGKQIVFNMRENYPATMNEKYYIPKIFRKTAALLLEKYMCKTLKKYNAIFAVTSNIVNIIKKEWECNHTFLITNYPTIDTSFNLTFDEYKNRGDVLCYIGTIYSISRQEIMFQALEDIPEIQYLIAGKFDENYKNLLDTLYWSKVNFIDGFKKEEMSKILAKASISNTLRDFSKTGSPNGSLGVIKIFESMEAAIPVLFSNVPVYQDIVEKYKCGICVNPNDPKEIKQALEYLINNKEEAYKMGQNGRKAVIEEYNWDNQYKLYEQVIKNLIINENN